MIPIFFDLCFGDVHPNVIEYVCNQPQRVHHVELCPNWPILCFERSFDFDKILNDVKAISINHKTEEQSKSLFRESLEHTDQMQIQNNNYRCFCGEKLNFRK